MIRLYSEQHNSLLNEIEDLKNEIEDLRNEIEDSKNLEYRVDNIEDFLRRR